MTTRRVLKKELVRVAYEIADAVERVLGTEVLNTQAIGRTVDDFIRGDAPAGAQGEVFENFTMLPLKIKDVPDSAVHFVFERWPITITLRVNVGVVNLTALESAYESHRSPHPHTRVRFREISHVELKRELREKLPKPGPKNS